MQELDGKMSGSRKKILSGTLAVTGTLAVAAAAVSLYGCGRTLEKSEVKKIKIGVTVYDQYDTYLSEMMERLNSYVDEKQKETGKVINVEINNAASSQFTQNSQVESMIEDGCDVICVNLMDRTDPTTVIDLAEKNNVPIIFFNRELVEEDLERWNRLYYVGANAFESGSMQGEMAAELFQTDASVDKNGDGTYQYVVLEGEAGHQDAAVRTECSVSAITNSGVEVEKLGYAIANWNRDQAQTKMAQLLNQYGDDIELVLANNDDMALGAVDALKAAKIKRENWPVILGIDGTDVGLNAVRRGDLSGTVYNDKEGQARRMLNLAYELVVGGDLSDLELQEGKYIRLPYKKVWPEDAKGYAE